MCIGNTAGPPLPATEKKEITLTNGYQSSGTKNGQCDTEALKTVSTNVMVMSDV